MKESSFIGKAKEVGAKALKAYQEHPVVKAVEKHPATEVVRKAGKFIEENVRAVGSDLTLGFIDAEAGLTEKFNKQTEEINRRRAQEAQDIRESYEREEREVQNILKEYRSLPQNTPRSQENKNEMSLLMRLKEAIIRRNKYRIQSLDDTGVDYLSGPDLEEFREMAKKERKERYSEAMMYGGSLHSTAIANERRREPDIRLRKEKMIQHKEEEVEEYFKSLSAMTPSARMESIRVTGMSRIVDGITEYGRSKETGEFGTISNTFLEGLRREGMEEEENRLAEMKRKEEERVAAKMKRKAEIKEAAKIKKLLSE